MRRLWFAFLALALIGSAAGVAQEAAEAGRILRESTEFEQMRPTLMLLVMAASCVISVIALFMSIKKESRAAEREQIGAVEDRIGKVEAQMVRAETDSKARDSEQTREIRSVHARMGQVEVQMKHLPDKDSVQEIAVEVARMGGEVASISKGLTSVDRAMNRVEDFLLGRSGK